MVKVVGKNHDHDIIGPRQKKNSYCNDWVIRCHYANGCDYDPAWKCFHLLWPRVKLSSKTLGVAFSRANVFIITITVSQVRLAKDNYEPIVLPFLDFFLLNVLIWDFLIFIQKLTVKSLCPWRASKLGLFGGKQWH